MMQASRDLGDHSSRPCRKIRRVMMGGALALLLSTLPATARATDSFYALYATGRYEEAIHAGEAAHDAIGFSVAARAVLAEATERAQPCLRCLERGEAFAQKAVAADPRLADAQVWLAVALGYESRIIGPLRARLNGNPARAKAALDRALEVEPTNPFALAALGGWHIEIVRIGGEFLARRLYGAEEARGLALFDRALKAAPGNVAVHYQIALSLAGYDQARFAHRIRAQLEAALACAPGTAYERFVHARAGALLALLRTDQDDAFATLVHKYQGYP